MKSGFPIEYISKDMTALCLFASAFDGKNDWQHLQKQGLKTVSLVDHEWKEQNQFGYKQITDDCFNFIEMNGKKQWDIVISDHWTGQDESIYPAFFAKMKTMAKKILICGISQEFMNKYTPPSGELYFRSNHNGGTYWLVVK